jgi:rhodanese-related sulfurtransferase
MITHLTQLFRMFVLAALGLAVTGCNHSSVSTESSTRRVGVEEFARMMQEDGFVLIDVRTPREFGAGHIPGARNIDVSSPSFSKEIAELDGEKGYLVYCGSGHRSARACESMTLAGFTNLFDLSPGFNGWKAAGREIQR